MVCFLRYQSDYLEQSERHASKREAVAAFAATARELDRYGQAIEASLHYAPDIDALAEYPDFILSLGKRGGVRITRA